MTETLTGDSHVSIRFPFIDDIHHLFRTGHKAFSAALNTQHIRQSVHSSCDVSSECERLMKFTPSHTGHGSYPHAQTGWSLWLRTHKRELITENWTTNILKCTTSVFTNHPKGHGSSPCRSQSRTPEKSQQWFKGLRCHETPEEKQINVLCVYLDVKLQVFIHWEDVIEDVLRDTRDDAHLLRVV